MENTDLHVVDDQREAARIADLLDRLGDLESIRVFQKRLLVDGPASSSGAAGELALERSHGKPDRPAGCR
jgi:hypothetical protein